MPKSLEAVRLGESPGTDIDGRLHAVLAAETDRVANAQVLVELLAPLLAERMGDREPARERARPAPVPAAARAPDTMPTIADFIDEMLSHEAAAARAPLRR